ncbi:hypothetical protein Scep_024143 [Stephania cephalantha]|uniref:Uncharacterized protein n=1 Tax=Stephania cephalantha TaxID=152367 RepID=A0AAP0F1G9_9MAGN
MKKKQIEEKGIHIIYDNLRCKHWDKEIPHLHTLFAFTSTPQEQIQEVATSEHLTSNCRNSFKETKEIWRDGQ